MYPLYALLVIAIYVFIERFLAIKKAATIDPQFMLKIRDQIISGNISGAKDLAKKTSNPVAKMIEKGIEPGYASKLIQYGWETITEGLKHGGITNMMDRLSNPAKIAAFTVAEELKDIMRPLFQKHMDDIISGHFSKTMMEDWANDDKNLLAWRAATGETNFEKTPAVVLSFSSIFTSSKTSFTSFSFGALYPLLL